MSDNDDDFMCDDDEDYGLVRTVNIPFMYQSEQPPSTGFFVFIFDE